MRSHKQFAPLAALGNGAAVNLVRADAHVSVRAIEDGNKLYFVESCTWRDAKIPDSAPPAIQAIWAEMNRLVEARGGRPGLEFSEVWVGR